MLVIGVRSSWLTLETKASLTWSTSRSRSTAWVSVASASTSASCAVTRSVMSSDVIT
jgi:hypothetical protein